MQVHLYQGVSPRFSGAKLKGTEPVSLPLSQDIVALIEGKPSVSTQNVLEHFKAVSGMGRPTFGLFGGWTSLRAIERYASITDLPITKQTLDQAVREGYLEQKTSLKGTHKYRLTALAIQESVVEPAFKELLEPMGFWKNIRVNLLRLG